ncbi:MAG: helix-turn-helix domain-containing protein [Lactobacillus sp.]|nr:helix-turn-helix domain-containing protein [Lactobacillus sp.]MCI2032646.1 helix-turn-helix domain-containing protein [Lactobacillus sp.]
MTLGQQLDEYRRAKGLSVQAMADAAQISRATYNRFVNDQSSLSFASLLALLNLLGLELAEVMPVLRADYCDLDAAWEKVQTALLAHDHVAAQQLAQELRAAAVQTHNRGYTELTSLVAIFDALANAEHWRAEHSALGLFHRLTRSRAWLDLDIGIFTMIAPLLPLDALASACWRFVGRLPVESTYRATRLARIGQRYLEVALTSHDAEAVYLAAAWLEGQPLLANRLDDRPLVHFAHLVAAVVCHGHDPKIYTQFRQHYQALAGDTHQLAAFDKLWALATGAAFRQPEQWPTPAWPQPFEPTADLGALFDAARTARLLTVEELCNQVGLSRSTWSRMRREVATTKLDVVCAVMSTLRLNFTDIQHLWTGGHSQVGQWFLALQELAAAGDDVQAQVAAFTDRLAAVPEPAPRQPILLLQDSAQLIAGECQTDSAQINAAVQSLWHHLNEEGDWIQFDYQVMIPLIEYLDYPKVRIVMSRYLRGNVDLSHRLPPETTDLLGVELLLGAVRSQVPANVDDALKVLRGLRQQRHGLNFVIGECFSRLIQALQRDDVAAARRDYHQTRAAVTYFAPGQQGADLIAMLDWLWDYLQ